MFRYNSSIAMLHFERRREFFPDLLDVDLGLAGPSEVRCEDPAFPLPPTDGLELAIYWLAHVSASCKTIKWIRESLEEAESENERREPGTPGEGS